MFLSLGIPLEYWIKHVTFGLLFDMLDSLPEYSTGEFQALQLISVEVMGVVD